MVRQVCLIFYFLSFWVLLPHATESGRQDIIRVSKQIDVYGISSLPFFSGAGYDQCNIPDCTAANIRVSNVPTIVDAATADTGIFLMLGAIRGFNVAMGNLRKGEWRGKKPPPLGQ